MDELQGHVLAFAFLALYFLMYSAIFSLFFC
jgi:hypothetical protein